MPLGHLETSVLRARARVFSTPLSAAPELGCAPRLSATCADAQLVLQCAQVDQSQCRARVLGLDSSRMKKLIQCAVIHHSIDHTPALDMQRRLFASGVLTHRSAASRLHLSGHVLVSVTQ